MSKIDIYRLELVFLNPGENRWQMFQEAPDDDRLPQNGDAEAVYRAQATGLLRWVREALSTHCKQKHKDEIQCARTITVKRHPDKLDLSNLQTNLERVSGSSDTYHECLTAIQRKMRAILRSEGLSLRLCRSIFSALHRKNATQIPLIRREALELVSALFVARRWDVYGRLSFPHKREVRASPATNNIFSYWLRYPNSKKHKKPISKHDTRAERALDYRVKIRFSGLKNSNKHDVYKRERSFYKVCHDLKSKKEDIWYCFYGILIDALHNALAGIPPTFPPVGRVHVTCLPLRICGYDHFLQLYVRGQDENVDCELSVERIFVKDGTAVRYKGSHVTVMTLLKECLRELLVQMHIAAFQHHVALDVANRRGMLGLAEVDEIFCRHAPNLVRVDEILIHDSKVCFGYSTNRDPLFEEWARIKRSRIIELRMNGPHIAKIRRRDRGEILAYVPWEKEFDGSLDPLFSGTGQQRLQEQYEWLHRRVEARNVIINQLR